MALDHVSVGDVAAPAARLARHQRHARVAVVPAGRESRGVGLDVNNYFPFTTIIFTSFYLVCVRQLLGLGDLEEDVVCAQGPPVLLVCQGVGLLQTVCSKISIYFYWNFIAL